MRTRPYCWRSFHPRVLAVQFLNHAVGTTPEEELLLQMQGMIAEYERAKIIERHRRGKLHRAKGGSVNVLSTAPYGYTYIRKQVDGEPAQYIDQSPAGQNRTPGVSLDGG